MAVSKTKSEPHKTVLVITVGFLIVHVITKMHWPLVTAIVIGLLGLLSGFLAKKIDYLWLKLSWVLSLIVPNIILSFVFFLILTPIAFLSKIFGEKNQLNLKNTAPSLFKDRAKPFEKVSFEKPW
jgi:hypothetical protein